MQNAINDDLGESPRLAEGTYLKQNDNFDDTFNDRDSPQPQNKQKSVFEKDDNLSRENTLETEAGGSPGFLSRQSTLKSMKPYLP